VDVNLQKLDDPAFFRYWATVRNQLALTPQSSPNHAEIKRRYNAVVSEYRRRMDGEPSSDR
jgi:hypothetical protein